MAFQIGDKYYHEDVESGEIVEISKSAYDGMMYWRQKVEAMVKPENKVKGTIIITSTMADDNDKNNFQDLWNQNDKQ